MCELCVKTFEISHIYRMSHKYLNKLLGEIDNINSDHNNTGNNGYNSLFHQQRLTHCKLTFSLITITLMKTLLRNFKLPFFFCFI